MAKRFIDTEIFNDEWFMGLDKDSKLLYIYLFTNCDHAGLIEVNIKLVEFLIQIKDLAKCLRLLGNRIIQFDEKRPNVYFLPKFIQFQYPDFPKSKVRQQESALKILEKNNIDFNTYLSVSDTYEHEPVSVNEPETVNVGEPEPLKALLDLWNYFAESYGVPQVIKLSKSRKDKLKTRLKDPDFNFKQILIMAEKQPFLWGEGNNSSGWKVSFDWIIGNDKNYIKIMENNYGNKESGTIAKLREDQENKQIDEIFAKLDNDQE